MIRIREEVRNEIIINKSRFIACIAPTKTEEEARSYIDEIRREFPDATHVCTAYVCGENNMIQRSSDNKEPSGTAGVPMLEAIKKSGISDMTACVVRYFGGIKLGAGGLVRAYSGAVSEAIALAVKTTEVVLGLYQVTYPYDMSGTLENWLRRNTEITDLSYDEAVTCLFESEDEAITDKILDITKGQIRPVFIQNINKEKAIPDH